MYGWKRPEEIVSASIIDLGEVIESDHAGNKSRN